MIETLIVPGLNGSGPGHWQREWAERDNAALVVEQDDWARPSLTDWLHRLEAEIERAPGVVLVAHSLGCALVANLAGSKAASHVAGALLVAPADVDRLAYRVPSVSSFSASTAVRLPFPSILVASRNDPFMSFRAAESQGLRWGSALVDLGEAGHVNVESGFGHWPDGFVLADGLRGRAGLASGRANPSDLSTLWHGRRAASAHETRLGIN